MLSKQVRFILYCLPISALLIGLLVVGANRIKEIDQELGKSQTNSSTLSSTNQINWKEFLYLSDSSSGNTEMKCISLTYFTSWPAKCLDANGKLIWVNPGLSVVPATPQK